MVASGFGVPRAQSARITEVQLLAEIRSVLEAGRLEPVGLSDITAVKQWKTSIEDCILEVLNDYETSQPQRVFTDEERAKALRTVDHSHP